MKHEMTLAGFLGIPPLNHNNETDISVTPLSGIPSIPMVNPSSGLPMTDNHSMIDVGGNVFGSSEGQVGCNMFEDDSLFQPLEIDTPTIIDDSTSSMSCSEDSFDNSMSDSFMNDDCNNSWDDL
ncbi:hypothetical protein [Paraglaciecola sp. L3A3]|uniref:hypothetical protein n=1 Tax=Paraglaciecola sp. L3A3 TaxID=2686358 RepID=UPI00131A8FD6|nr:hypothetical protein [Paraglaciecola sp. L3A3]